MKTHFFVVLVLLGFVVGCTESNVRQASREFSSLPGVVQKAVRDKSPNAEIAGVEERERNGHTTYVIQFRDSQLHPEMEVAADGTLIRYEAGAAVFGRPGDGDGKVRGSNKADLSALPVEVQQAIQKNAPKADVVDIRRRDDNGKVVYEIEYAGNEPRRVVHVTADGTLVPDSRSDR